MSPKIKTNLMALAVALGVLVAGYGFGEPPSQAVSLAPATTLAMADSVEPIAQDAEAALRAHRISRGALKRQIAMPYVSMAALITRRES
ncbi:hypothetical protein [Arenimonas donghaensis]|uniref:Uncharacterized protein n=1 Tax=Arenimonas donghaensis DSM 18148 = HO3-R19 TaxID=1121014 RepID=A0A087MMI7_9GAMM|nr:hypothetical protein [Arenimonas donghaensis]KFL38090.1 hypothetical protein N788_02625 [Arenimonas donghaensis DSM 18148 = HO3-R19]